MSQTDQSIDLASQLELIEQQTLFGSETLKYSIATIKELKIILSSRNYVNLTWELSHLLWALVHTDKENSILSFFFVEECVSANAARSWFAHEEFIASPSHQITIQKQGLNLVLRDHEFTINWSRFNLLAALLELLIFIQPELLVNAKGVFGKGLNSIKLLSSDLQKALYEWIETFMPSARAHKKYMALNQYFDSKDYDKVDSQFVQAWADLSDMEGFSKIRNFFSSVCSFLSAREESVRIESLSEYDEQSISASSDVYDYISSYSEQNLLESLPSVPKVLSQKQVKKIEVIFENAIVAAKLPWSSLTTLNFSHTQSQLVQALRANASSLKRQQLIDNSEDYMDQLAFLSALMKINEQSMLACLDILITTESEFLLTAITENKQWLSHFKNIEITVENSADLIAEHLINAAPELVKMAHETKRKVKRTGFTDTSIIDDGEVYLTLIKTLSQTNKILCKLCTFECRQSVVDAKYLSDRSIVKNEFGRRYLV